MRHETALAGAITKFLDLALPDGAVHFHVPNEGRRTKHEQAEFKACGGKAGIPDRWVLYAGRSLPWEEKSANGRLSASQREMFPRVAGALHMPGIPEVRSVEDAERVLRSWGIPLRASVLGLR